MTNKIINIEDCYNNLKVTDYWKQPSHDTCRNIVKFLNSYVLQNPQSARAYYLRSVAKFHLIDLIPHDYFWCKDSAYAKEKTYNGDGALEDYKKAISIDTDVVSKNPDVRVIMVSSFSGLKYYFRKPCSRKDLDKMLTYNDPISFWIGIFIFIVVISFIIGNILHYISLPDKYLSPFVLTGYTGLILSLTMNIYHRKMSRYIDKLHKELCEEVVTATWDEVK